MPSQVLVCVYLRCQCVRRLALAPLRLLLIAPDIYTLKAIGTDDFDDVQPVKRADTDKA